MHLRSACRELYILTKLAWKKPNEFITELIDVFCNIDSSDKYEGLNQVFLVLEYIPYSLGDLLEDYMNETVCETILYRVLLCLKFLHSSNLIHRDLKPENILISSTCQVKICDFGFSRNLHDVKAKNPKGRKQRSLSPNVFTRQYRPPEVLLGKRNYDQKCDVWSFGCIASEMMTCLAQSQANQPPQRKILFNGLHSYLVSPNYD